MHSSNIGGVAAWIALIFHKWGYALDACSNRFLP
jgi:hypothetical protein